ncbi:hypothetical protein [Paenibacillus silviterrae]|uniref:hypothetical protein n=1 Tax=Paenibacillus silviterrae TaxID=3242194 RepID=UPI0025430022|nr:hypothetical protein [Paenibacillus chinjuensis]
MASRRFSHSSIVRLLPQLLRGRKERPEPFLPLEKLLHLPLALEAVAEQPDRLLFQGGGAEPYGNWHIPCGWRRSIDRTPHPAEETTG